MRCLKNQAQTFNAHKAPNVRKAKHRRRGCWRDSKPKFLGYAVINNLATRQIDANSDVVRNGNISSHTAAEPTSRKCHREHPDALGESVSCSVAVNAFQVLPLREIAGTDRLFGFVEEQAIRADRIVAVMLDNDRLPQQPAERQRNQARSGEVN